MLGRTITRSILRSRIRPRGHIQEVVSSLTILLVGSFGGSCCLGFFFNNHCSIVRSASASASASTTTEQNSSGPSSGSSSSSSSSSTCSTFTLDYFNNGGCSWEKERRHPYRSGNSFLLATSASQNINSSEDANANVSAKTDANASVDDPCVSVSNARTYSTDADTYFQKHHRIPLPSIMHESLDAMILKDDRTRTLHVVGNAEAQAGADCEDENEHEHENKNENKQEQVPASNKILVIGDVHGCFNELKSLHAKAMKEHNDNKHFAAVVLVGDLCNKGPDSAKVIQFVRNEYGWYSVRGNHDNSGLAAALGAGVGNGDGGGDGGGKRCVRPKYEWVYSLSDDDVAWMEGLPYTIRIPKTMVSQGKELGHQHQHHHKNEDENVADDVIIVHAGFVPNIDLVDQETQTMITIRDIVLDSDPDSNTDAKHYKYHKLSDVNIETDVDVDVEQEQHPQAWARTWDGPNLVIFGHDAKRGIQHERFAIGLDSGACYGKKLTGIVLPEKEFVAVDAEKVHCPIN